MYLLVAGTSTCISELFLLHQKSELHCIAIFSFKMKVAEWLFYFGIGSIAILFLYNGKDIEQFRNKATNFKIKQVPHTKRPVITICPGHSFTSEDPMYKYYK